MTNPTVQGFSVLLTVKEVQEILGVSRNTVYALIRSGELRAKTVGRQYRILPADLSQYMTA